LDIIAVKAQVASQQAFVPRMPNKANHAEMQRAVSAVLRVTGARHQAAPAKRHRSGHCIFHYKQKTAAAESYSGKIPSV
jgi:hypothetical protein